MDMLARLIAALRGLVRRRRIDAEWTEELRDHLERETAANVARGLSPEEARCAAIADFGGIALATEEVRAVRTVWLDGFWRDVRYGLRSLRRSPGFAATALALLVVGIGSTTAIFSVVHAVLLRPLPYPEPDGLVFLSQKDGHGIAWPTFEDWRRRATSFDALAASVADAVIVTSTAIPQRVESRGVTANFFQVLGAEPYRGRLFDEADAHPTAPATAVISHALWQRHFGAEESIVGRTITLNRQPFVVAGVLPPGFRYVTSPDVYVVLERQVAAGYRGMQSRNTQTDLYAVGRLKSDRSLSTARVEMQAITAALSLEHSGLKGHDAELLGLAERTVQRVAPTLRVLAGAAALLMVIACVNVASLLMNRAVSRAHELGVRAALGGTRSDLIRQLLVEQTLLVLAGGLGGAMAGTLLLHGLLAVAPQDMPRLQEIRLDPAMLAWTTVVCCACAFLFGLLPALKASRIDGQQLVIRAGRATGSTVRARQVLAMAQIAVATVLLSGAALMVNSMLRLTSVDLGFDPRSVQTFMFSLSGPDWPNARKQASYDLVVERLRRVPGVESAALTYSLPILGSNLWNVFMIDGVSAEHWTAIGTFPNAGMVPVTSTYFDTLRVPLATGRYFDRSDGVDSLPVAIVNSRAARAYWPSEDPIGKRIRQGYPDDPFGPWRTIVGVVGDIKQDGQDRETPPQVFVPLVQQPRTTVVAVVRTRGPVSQASLTAALHQLDPTIPVFSEQTLEHVMHESTSRRRVTTVVLSVFGGVAALLATIGLYGVIAQGVADRRREIGLRLALGATGRQVASQFLRQSVVVVAAGISLGLLVTAGATRSLASLVFGVTPTDPLTLVTVVGLLAAVTFLASYLPARSAARVDPVETLRSE